MQNATPYIRVKELNCMNERKAMKENLPQPNCSSALALNKARLLGKFYSR